MTFNVTQEHIDKGVSICSKCPIALAILDVLPCVIVDVHLTWIAIFRLEEHRKVRIYFEQPSQELRDFISRFDGGPPMKKPAPMSFQLDIPEHLLCSQST